MEKESESRERHTDASSNFRKQEITVSYTHLPAGYEVAREQMQLNKSSCFTSLPPCSGKLSYETKDNILSLQSGAVSGKIDLKKGISVSYTHLDVYKRQTQGRLGNALYVTRKMANMYLQSN